MTGAGQFVELQATAEHVAFNDSQMAEMITLARAGIGQLVEIQKKAAGV
jgi:ribonuclease PH